MKKWAILENIKVEKLIFGGKWLAIGPDWKKIIITGGAIPGSIVNLRILKSKSKYLEAQVLDVVKKSPLEKELPANFQVYWGCKWLPIDYRQQLKIKEEQVKEALFHLKDFTKNTKFHPIVASDNIYWYRNKLEFSFWKYISAKEEIHDDFRFGFHKQWEFDRIINCEYCVLASDTVNGIFKEVDTYSRNSQIPTYDPFNGIWFWRHLVVREAHYTGEIMIIFSVNDKTLPENFMINFLDFIKKLTSKFPNIKSVYYLKNSGKADIVQWEYELVFWEKTIKEKLLDFTFEINPRSFFQTNSMQAEVLYSKALELANLSKENWEIALDLYAGTGTIWIILSKYFKKVYSVELVKEASIDGQNNAKLNNVENVEFINMKVEDFLKEFVSETGLEFSRPVSSVDLLVIDPPRDGMHTEALPNIISFDAKTIIYVSCNPSTLARDLDYIVKNSKYSITDVIPVDMFPHTHHIETIVKLIKK